MKTGGIKAVVMGGGTGTFTVLSALKNYIPHLTAVVNMVDDGGSTGILRDELGALPPGDIRQCLVALSPDSHLMRELMNYRFATGRLAGHPFGNLMLSALEKIDGNFAKAVKTAGKILNISGQVVPITVDDVRLCLRLGGRVLVGEKTVTQSFFKVKHPQLFLRPKAKINPDAAKAIAGADIIIMGPGNLYSSLIPNLLVEGVTEALVKAKAKKIYVCNLVSKPGQTDGFKVHDFVKEIESYSAKGLFDYVIYNNRKPEGRLLKRYEKLGEEWTEYDKAILKKAPYKAVGASLISARPLKQSSTDKLLKRNLIRHDADRLARQIMQIYFA